MWTYLRYMGNGQRSVGRTESDDLGISIARNNNMA